MTRPPRRWPPRPRAGRSRAAGDRCRPRSDLIILATSTPDQTFPASATIVQAGLGINDCIAFDVQAVCSGFLYALSVADSMIVSGAANHALVIGAETFSRILDWEDRATCVLFGDGAGAVVLKAEHGTRGMLASRLHADGRHNQLLYVDGGPSTTGTVGKLRMRGQEVFRHAVTNLAEVLREVMGVAGLTVADIDWVVPHQANRRILDATARKLGLPAGQGDRHGRPPREYLGRLGPARARHGRARRTDQARRPAGARSDGRWLHLGGCGGPLLKNSSI